MLIDKINLNHLRIFESVCRNRSMTKAAEELHMTQSGVSQHIKVLEDMLDVTLFDRIKQRPVPTQAALTLYRQCSVGLNHIEQALMNLKGTESVLSGNIAIGLPIEFGNNFIIPLLVDFAKRHTLVSYSIRYGLASEMDQALLTGDLDFAIVDDLPMDKAIKISKIYDEALCLCCSKEYMENLSQSQKSYKTEDEKTFFESLAYIDYASHAPLILAWFNFHYNKQNWIRPSLKSIMMDVQGIAKMIICGMGVGVLPYHHVKKLEVEGHELHIFPGSSKKLLNAISIAYVEERSIPTRVRVLMDQIAIYCQNLS
ncbi:MAG: LysR family transcriptional regulator [Oligoflexia bacterium]|nr:LysR family transcriptional regulator [Oligoflexia bacterium]MBF0366053.1 LysR family transcriptional regulator [Oligoflexia bacterium]